MRNCAVVVMLLALTGCGDLPTSPSCSPRPLEVTISGAPQQVAFQGACDWAPVVTAPWVTVSEVRGQIVTLDVGPNLCKSLLRETVVTLAPGHDVLIRQDGSDIGACP
jgi:hypothetical protein